VTALYIDTHAHLDDDSFDGDRAEVMARARAQGVHQIINVGYRPERWQPTIALQENNSMISVMLGIHPQHVTECDKQSLQRLGDLLISSGAVALGEIGLDYARPPFDAERQRAALVSQLDLAHALHLPVVIHQRAAEDDLIDVLEAIPDLPPLVLHSFEGTRRLGNFAIGHNFRIGIGGLATRQKAAPLREVLLCFPMESLVLETDSPYLVPARVRQQRNEPMYIPTIAAALAPVWGLTREELGAITTRTAVETFGLSVRDGHVGQGTL